MGNFFRHGMRAIGILDLMIRSATSLAGFRISGRTVSGDSGLKLFVQQAR
jgi:hypothetical protein